MTDDAAPPRPSQAVPLSEGTITAPRAPAGALSREPRLFARSARMLINGCQALPAMLEAIAGARRSVDLETYILRDDATGRGFADALIAAARRGVRTRLLYDGVGSLGLHASYLRPLVAAGVDVAVFNPVRLFGRPLKLLSRRDHRKILIVDGRWSFTGGLNIADDYACGPDGWRDTHVMLDGEEVAAAFSEAFAYAWERSERVTVPGAVPNAAAESGAAIPPPGTTSEAPAELPLRLITNHMFGQRRRIRNAYRRAVQGARQSVLIENAYFIPDPSFRRALSRAARRGVRVSLVLAARTDVRLAQLASRAAYPPLLKAGVRIYEWSETVLHAKTMVVDDSWSFVGSYNLDHLSLKMNLEAVVLIEDRTFAGELRRQTEADIARCREVTLAECRARPWHEKLMQKFAYWLRFWL